ncbi:aldehyde dehydrogenase family protein [Marinomonas arenicola]|uniref:aldehyde dehydrogenase family protein n=1 Tax=Marinomonas arenicola TaxID=569601 RepID=UPI0031201989
MDWVVEQLDSGTVWINNHAEVLPHIHFGGNKLSGLGVEFGVEGFLENTQRKVVSHFK